MTAQQQAMMLQLQQIGLTMDDLRIYLDTHLDDAFAVERFNIAAEDYRNLLEDYVAQYGPLTWTCPQEGSSNEWVWGMSEFPWQY